VGKDGTILHYGGDEWSVMEFPSGTSAADLGDVDGIAGGRVIAVGAGGMIIQHNGGGVWEAMAADTVLDLHGVCLCSDAEAYAVGDDGNVLAFDGLAWTTVFDGLEQTLMGAACSPGGGGWAVGHENSSGMSSVVLRLGGYVPEAVSHPSAHFLYAVAELVDPPAVDVPVIVGMYQQAQSEDLHFEIWAPNQTDPFVWDSLGQGSALILDVAMEPDGRRWAVGFAPADGDPLGSPVIYSSFDAEIDVVEAYQHPSTGAFRAVWKDVSTDTGCVLAVGDDGLIVRGDWTQY
jgi:hypothetical protein